MTETDEDLKRAVQTLQRSIESSETVNAAAEQSNKLLMAAVQQLVLVVEKLVEQLGARETHPARH